MGEPVIHSLGCPPARQGAGWCRGLAASTVRSPSPQYHTHLGPSLSEPYLGQHSPPPGQGTSQPLTEGPELSKSWTVLSKAVSLAARGMARRRQGTPPGGWNCPEGIGEPCPTALPPPPHRAATQELALLISRMQANADQVERDILETQKRLQEVRPGGGQQGAGPWDAHCHGPECLLVVAQTEQRTFVLHGPSPMAVPKRSGREGSAVLLCWAQRGSRGGPVLPCVFKPAPQMGLSPCRCGHQQGRSGWGSAGRGRQ